MLKMITKLFLLLTVCLIFIYRIKCRKSYITAKKINCLWLEVLTVHGNDQRLFRAKAIPLLIMLMSRIWHSSSSHNFHRFQILHGLVRASPSQRRADTLRVMPRTQVTKMLEINITKTLMKVIIPESLESRELCGDCFLKLGRMLHKSSRTISLPIIHSFVHKIF